MTRDLAKTIKFAPLFTIAFQAPNSKYCQDDVPSPITATTVSMGFFNRKPHNGPDAPLDQAPRRHHAKNDGYYSMSTRPSFGQWLKYTWLDIVTMACMGAIGLGVGFPSQGNDKTALLTEYHYRSTKHTQPQLDPSPSPSQTVRSSTPNSPTHCVKRLCQFGPPLSWPLSSPSSYSW